MSDPVPYLLGQLLEEQRKTNARLEKLIQLQGELIQALAEEGQDPDAPPARYLDGSRLR